MLWSSGLTACEGGDPSLFSVSTKGWRMPWWVFGKWLPGAPSSLLHSRSPHKQTLILWKVFFQILAWWAIFSGGSLRGGTHVWNALQEHKWGWWVCGTGCPRLSSFNSTSSDSNKPERVCDPAHSRAFDSMLPGNADTDKYSCGRRVSVCTKLQWFVVS